MYDDMDEGARTEIGGMNVAIPPTDPNGPIPPPQYNDGAFAGNPEDGCEYDGTPMPCSIAARLAELSPLRDIVRPKKPGEYPAPRYVGGYKEDAFPDDFVFADNVNRKQNRKGLRLFRGRESGSSCCADLMQTHREPSPSDLYDALRGCLTDQFKLTSLSFRLWQASAGGNGDC